MPDHNLRMDAGERRGARGAAAKLADLIAAGPGWSPSLVALALPVGFMLLALGLWGEIWITLDGVLAVTFIVSGLALIFGAFGAQATVQRRGWVITGVAAVALVFLAAISYFRQDSYAIVELLTSKKPSSSLRMGSSFIKGGVTLVGETQRIRFVIFRNEMGSDEQPSFVIAVTSESERQVCFPRERIVPWFGRSSYARWALDEAKMAITDLKGHEVGSELSCYGRSTLQPRGATMQLVTPAHAQVAGDLNALIEDVLSDNTDVRRLTRDRIAEMGTPAVRPLLDNAKLLTEQNDRRAFRMNVGSAVAINNMLFKKGTTTTAALYRELTPDDFDAMVQWSLHSDSSLRIPAAGILASTADVPTLQNLTRATLEARNENVVYNSAWILMESSTRLKADREAVAAVKSLAGQLRQASNGAKTLALLDKIEAAR